MPHSSSLSSSAVICCGDFQARVAAVEARNIAEFALVGTAARILDAAEKIMPDVGELIGGNWKFGHVEPVGGLQHHLLLGARRITGDARDQLIGGVTEFADMKIIEGG